MATVQDLIDDIVEAAEAAGADRDGAGVSPQKQEMFATKAIAAAWANLQNNITVESMTGLFEPRSGAPFGPNEFTGKSAHPSWLARFATPRELRDTLAIGFQSYACEWEGKDASDNVSTEEAAAIFGAGLAPSALIATITASLTTAGVSAAAVTSVGAALSAGLASLGPAGAAIGAMVACVVIITLVCGDGCAAGKTCHPYMMRLRAIGGTTLDLARRMRDDGARLSVAYADVPAFSTSKSGRDVVWDPAAQRELENWVAAFLLQFNGLPSVIPYAEVISGRDEPCLVNNKMTVCRVTENVGKRGLDWLKPNSEFMQRYLFALFAGLGRNEAEWLAHKPGTRTGSLPTQPKKKDYITMAMSRNAAALKIQSLVTPTATRPFLAKKSGATVQIDFPGEEKKGLSTGERLAIAGGAGAVLAVAGAVFAPKGWGLVAAGAGLVVGGGAVVLATSPDEPEATKEPGAYGV